MTRQFRPGIESLLTSRLQWIAGKKIGLLSHAAAVDSKGTSSAELLASLHKTTLCSIFGPEHGFFGSAGAGQSVRTVQHPQWRIPVYSLYGKRRKPTRQMFRDLDVIIIDLQDLGIRPYTYVSTLRYALEAASKFQITAIVADRPVPLPCSIDGPVTDPDMESFVASAPVPMSYAMTQGETALWLRNNLKLDLDLKIAKMRSYTRSPSRSSGCPPWIPPSPGIVSWETAQCYPATVFAEAMPSIDHGRTTALPFQIISAPWIKSSSVLEHLAGARLQGVRFLSHQYMCLEKSGRQRLADGIRIVVTDPNRFRPILTSITIISILQELYGENRLWRDTSARPDFFDKLYGTSSVRNALIQNEPVRKIEKTWRSGISDFVQSRKECVLYERN
ncbi:MAG: DUF1343 domain-containing protein [Kiritimatiellae bacterium]|nr:DUF1343 domain-containing protein [Kiritimatiellia bacterium]